MDVKELAKDQSRRILTKDLDDAQHSLNRLVLMIIDLCINNAMRV
jgi:hypothetical protein